MEIMSRRDIEAGYMGSFLGLRDQTGYVTPCMVDGSWDQEGDVGMWFMPVDKEGEMQRRKRVLPTDERIVWEHPDTGLYLNEDGTCFSFVRRSGRQYIRGVRPDYVRINNRGADPRTLGKHLHIMYNPYPYLNWPQAKAALDGGVDNTAMSIFLSAHKADDGIIIKLRNEPIGEVKDGQLNGNAAFTWIMEEIGYDTYA